MRMREKREKGEEGREWVSRVTWTPRQYLTVILTLFDHFNGLSHGMG